MLFNLIHTVMTGSSLPFAVVLQLHMGFKNRMVERRTFMLRCVTNECCFLVIHIIIMRSNIPSYNTYNVILLHTYYVRLRIAHVFT